MRALVSDYTGVDTPQATKRHGNDMPPLHSPQVLLKELQEHNGFFDELVDMFPSKLYIAGNSGECSPGF
jgi:hypothetical protein